MSAPGKLGVFESDRLGGGIGPEDATLQQVPLTQAQREELDRRLDDFQNHPDQGSCWEEVRERILRTQ